jgi:hypothetical protein
VSATEVDLDAAIKTARTGRSSWRFFMLAGLALLILESLFADRILRRSHSAQSQTGPAPQQMEVA